MTVGKIYNYGGDNYRVTRVDPDRFLVGDRDSWSDAVEFTDHVQDGETATITYVTGLDAFESNYKEGEITEGADASTLPADQLPPSATQLPADDYQPAPKVDNSLPGYEKPEAKTKD